MLVLGAMLGLPSAHAHPSGRAALPRLSIDDVSQLEGTGGGWTQFHFTVSLSSATSVRVKGRYDVALGTAQANDVKETHGQFRIKPGEMSTTVKVKVKPDKNPEPDETFLVTLSQPDNATIDDEQGVGTILDDDGGAGGGGLPSISVDDPSTVEGNSGKHGITFTVSLSHAASNNVSVDYATREGTADDSKDYDSKSGSIQFKPGETSKSVVVQVRGDTLAEGDETFFLQLKDPKNAVIEKAQGTATILDDELPRLSISDTSLLEGDSGLTNMGFTVSLSAPAPPGGVTFTVGTQDQSASAPSDYTTTTVGGSIPAGNTQFTFTVPIVGDTTVETDETFLVNVTGVVGASVADAQAVGTITNDDGGGGTTPALTIDPVQLNEGNIGSTPFVFTVTLAPTSNKTVKVDYATANGTAQSGLDYGPIAGQLTFTPGQLSKTVTVFVTGDTQPEPNETFLVNLSNPENATLGQSQATGTIVNDDDESPVAAPQSQTTLEDTPKLITLSATDAEGENLTFAVDSGPSNGALGSIGTPNCNGSTPSTCTATVTYTPGANFNGSDSFDFTANDGFSDSLPATVALTVTAVNDEPSFTKGADQSVLENSGAHSIANWATAISKGPADESGQSVTFHVSNDNNALFSSQPAVSASGTLSFTPATDALGTATVDVYLSDDGGTANGGDDTSPTQTFSIEVTLLNHAPSFDLPASPNQTVLEDAGAQMVTAFATNISKGPANESGQTVTFHVSNDNNGLFSSQPDIDESTGNLTFTPAANANGSATVSVYLTDNGGTANGGDDTSDTQTFTIGVTAVNDEPSFTKGADQSVLENSGAHSIANWATAISKGPADESGQSVTFHVSNDNNALFSSQPAVSSGGTLSFTPATDAIGTATVSVYVTDSGGTANGGDDQSPTQTFSIEVTILNHAPSFDLPASPNQTVLEDAGAQTVTAFATNISKGPANESGQTVTFHVSNNANGLFSSQPDIDESTGNLTYTPAANANGSATVSVYLTDDGGTANGGDDTSDTQTFTIGVTAVNDEPSFDLPASPNQTVIADQGAQTVSAFATNMSKGPANESSQTLTFHVSNDDNSLFDAQPSIDPTTGNLTYTPNAAGDGTATVSVYLTDSGGTANGGDDQSPTKTFDITVVPPNREPTADDQSVSTNEDTLKTVTLGGGDLDGDALTFTITKTPDHGSLGSIGTPSCAGTPSVCTATVDYTPALNYNGPDSFKFKVNDGTVDSTTDGTVSITVNAVDDPPVAVDDTATVLEDASATTIDVLANDTDVDGGTKTVTAKTNGANGATVTITNAGADLTYQPAANFCGSDTFTYTLNGGDVGDVNVTVTCVNDVPSFTKGANQGPVDNQTGAGAAKAYTVSGWATAISKGAANESGQTVDFVIDSVTPSNLFTVQPAVAANGDLTYTTDPANSGTATVVLHIHDDGGTANGGVNASATQSFTIQTVNPAPIAVDDSYTATGNVSINVNQTAEGVLQRGTDDTLFSAVISHCGPTNAAATAVSAGTCTTTSANGGSIVLNTNGQFTYNPPAGFLGTDHFFYKLTNNGGSDVGDVTVTVSDMIWFFDASNAAAGDGRLSNPFQQISSFVNDNAAGHGKDNQTLFISNGTYDDPLTLRAGQILVGKGAGAAIVDIPATAHITLAPFSVTLPTTGGTRPSLTTASGSAITLGSGNTIRGLNVGNTAVSDIVGSSFGTLALSEVDLGGTGQALDLTTGTANATFGSVTSTSGTNGIKLSSVAGTLNFGTGGALSGSSGAELLVSGGSNTWTYPGTITKTAAGRTVDISGRTGGTITLSGAISGTGGVDDGVSLSSNTGATIALTGGVTLSTGASTAFSATGGGTVNVTGAGSSLTTTTGVALNVANTTIGSSGLTFQSISAGTAASGPANGVVLNTTGSSGGLTVTGDSGSANNASGGTIQKTSSNGIALTSTRGASFDQMNLQNNGGSGVRGFTAVQDFTFTNGTINNSGTGGGNQESSIAFNDPSGSATDAKVTGTVTITGNTLTNALWHGVSILQFGGALSDVDISNNTITSGTTTGTGGNSFGSGIQLFVDGDGSTASSVARAELNGNTITNFPGGVLIAAQCGTANSAGPTADCGNPGDGTNDIEIKNNILNGGGTTPNGSGGFVKPNQIMLVTVNGRGKGQFTIQNNGTAGDPLSGSAGNVIDISAGGAVTLQATVTGNQIDAAGQTVSGTSGIAAGVGPFTVTGPNTLSTSTLYATVLSNTIHNSAGSGIRLNVNAGDPTLNAIVKSNTVGSPISATYGIQIQEGPNAGFTGNTNLEISGNTTAGGTGGGNTFPGIGLRKFGTGSGEFAIVGLTPSPATNGQMETNVAGQNPGSSSGTFGTGGVAAINGASSNWTSIASVPTP